jgi:tetratricopeptide (TPR) repeat protein
VRLQDGRVAEPTGQLRFDFMHSEDAVALLSIHDGWTAEDWFAKAVEFEDLDQPAEAAIAYRKAIELEPNDPVIHFNLANSLYGCGDQRGAIESFQAAVRLDPTYVEGWNNLANVLTELGQDDEAVEAFEHALSIVPTYADAHYNLAETLSSMGRNIEARRHWRAYLQYGPPGDWADKARSWLE